MMPRIHLDETPLSSLSSSITHPPTHCVTCAEVTELTPSDCDHTNQIIYSCVSRTAVEDRLDWCALCQAICDEEDLRG